MVRRGGHKPAELFMSGQRPRGNIPAIPAIRSYPEGIETDGARQRASSRKGAIIRFINTFGESEGAITRPSGANVFHKTDYAPHPTVGFIPGG